MSEPIHVISLGAGVQSSTMALMAAHGEIEPMPACAIFADTGWEPAAVYEWLAWLESQLPFPVVRVQKGNIREDQEMKQRSLGKAFPKGERLRCASMPFFVGDGAGGAEGITRRQCTAEYKIEPIDLYLKREILGLKPRQRAPKTVQIVQWRGISADEASRMKPSRESWFSTRYPLAMEHRMSRQDCLRWMERKGYPVPPRSACLGCPYHSNDEWRAIRERPEEWAQVVEFDKKIRWAGGMTRPTYLHRQCVPLEDVDLSTAADHGQRDLFGEECEGMCGL